MAASILITGASGLIGTRLTEMLLARGHSVRHLGRTRRAGQVQSFVWDIARKEMDGEALEDVTSVIHLAGAGVAEKRWTYSHKKLILESRTQSTAFLVEKLRSSKSVDSLICASGIGYYGFFGGSDPTREESAPGSDFLAQVVVAWEKEADAAAAAGIRTVKFRTGIVLTERGGALKELSWPVRWGIGAPLGSGKQWVSWIHLDDLCGMFIHAVETKSMTGAYNATGPYAVTNEELTRILATVLHRPLWLPNVPAFALRLIIGEMADVVLTGVNVSSERARKAGFAFQYPTLERALVNLMGK